MSRTMQRCTVKCPIVRDHQWAVAQIVRYPIKIVKVTWTILHRSESNEDTAPHSPVFSWKNWRRRFHGHIIRMCLHGMLICSVVVVITFFFFFCVRFGFGWFSQLASEPRDGPMWLMCVSTSCNDTFEWHTAQLARNNRMRWKMSLSRNGDTHSLIRLLQI